MCLCRRLRARPRARLHPHRPDLAPDAGSRALVAARDANVVYVADADNGAVVRLSLDDGEQDVLPVGDRPARLFGSDGQWLVTLRGTGELVEIADVEGRIEELRRAWVGAEPYGVVADAESGAAWVALSTADAVVQLDTDTLTEQRRWEIPGEPRWLALGPYASWLFVGSAFGDVLHAIDLDTGRVSDLPLPVLYGETPDPTITARLAARVTGDLAVSPDGQTLAVPTLYVNNTDDGTRNTNGYYAPDTASQPGRFHPVIVTDALGVRGGIESRTDPVSIALRGHALIDPEPVVASEVLPMDSHWLEEVRGYVTSLVFDPSGRIVLGTMESSRTVFAVELDEAAGKSSQVRTFGGRETKTKSRPDLYLGAHHGPTGLAFMADGSVAVWSFLDRRVSTLDYAAIDEELAPTVLPEDVERGRHLFYSATDGRMAADGGGVSCSTCHFDGRNDGNSWDLENGPRSTPSLAGLVSATAPVTWEGDVQTVIEEALLTSTGRMGGTLEEYDAADVAAFIDWPPLPAVEVDELLADRVALGAGVFFRPEVGCGTCHSGAYYTDGQAYDLLPRGSIASPTLGFDPVMPMPIDTPTLLGLSRTAPYLHDGRAATLDEVLTETEGLGDVTGLTEDGRAALLDFMRAL